MSLLRTNHFKRKIATLLAIIYTSSAAAQKPAQQLAHSKTLPASSIRYVIVENVLVHNGRVVLILIDPESFSEANLTEVFGLLSKRFPSPNQLGIAAFTNLKQVPTPEESDFLDSTEGEGDLEIFKDIDRYPNANYDRVNGSQSFDYSMGNGHPKKVVIITGKPD